MESTRQNRFAGKLNLKPSNQTANVSTPKIEASAKPSSKNSETPSPTPAVKQSKTVKKTTKRNNNDYQQISAYLKKQTYINLKKSLFDSGEELSDLLERLVTNYLKK